MASKDDDGDQLSELFQLRVGAEGGDEKEAVHPAVHHGLDQLALGLKPLPGLPDKDLVAALFGNVPDTLHEH